MRTKTETIDETKYFIYGFKSFFICMDEGIKYYFFEVKPVKGNRKDTFHLEIPHFHMTDKLKQIYKANK